MGFMEWLEQETKKLDRKAEAITEKQKQEPGWRETLPGCAVLLALMLGVGWCVITPDDGPKEPPSPEEQAVHDADTLHLLLGFELRCQKEGRRCLERWASNHLGRAEFHNLLDFEFEETFRCRHKGHLVDGFVGTVVRAQAQNAFGAKRWVRYVAAGARTAPDDDLRLVYLGDDAQDSITFCVMLSVLDAYEKLGLTLPEEPAAADQAAGGAADGGPPPSP